MCESRESFQAERTLLTYMRIVGAKGMSEVLITSIILVVPGQVNLQSGGQSCGLTLPKLAEAS